jgi:hypothetical protein
MEQIKEQCIRARLVAKQQDGQYVKYVFEDILFVDHKYRFITMTRCPNWHGQEPTCFQEGFVTFKPVQAGKDTYYCNQDQTFKQYNYTAIYYIEFVPVTHVLKNGYVIEKGKLKVS